MLGNSYEELREREEKGEEGYVRIIQTEGRL